MAGKTKPRTRRAAQARPTYSLLDVMSASPSRPLAEETRRAHLSKLWMAIHSLETAPEPTPDDWRICSDAVNHVETLVTANGGLWRDCDGDLVQIEDRSGLLEDAIRALALAGARHKEGQRLRLDAAGIVAVRAISEDYAELVATLPHRTIVLCHRETERRIRRVISEASRGQIAPGHVVMAM